MKKFFVVTLIFLLIFSQPVFALPLARKIVVLDAGHGGWDPGMVRGDVEEKHINLAITQKLQTFLEQGGATVFITRLDDSELAKNKKGDMHARRLIANTSHADIFVSIHQNAFASSSVHGAQVFYFNESDNSQKLATSVQNNLRDFVDPSNKFKPKANDNYFVLKQTAMPAVLVECGFLTNYNEKVKLLSDAYQEKIAWAIYMGIVDYFIPAPEPSLSSQTHCTAPPCFCTLQ
jgi:N-acetylmuramoyl-L-alanine amidase